jgi:hypothetical protein
MLAIHTFCVLFLRWKPTDWVLYTTLIGGWLLIGFLVVIGPAAFQSAIKGPYCTLSCIVSIVSLLTRCLASRNLGVLVLDIRSIPHRAHPVRVFLGALILTTSPRFLVPLHTGEHRCSPLPLFRLSCTPFVSSVFVEISKCAMERCGSRGSTRMLSTSIRLVGILLISK